MVSDVRLCRPSRTAMSGHRASLRGPIGIFIGSKTPPEIAVSVMAEILAVKNGVALPRDLAVGEAKNLRDIPPNDDGGLVCGV